MSQLDKMVGVWKGHYHDSFGWDCRLELEISSDDGNYIGTLKIEHQGLHETDRSSLVLSVTFVDDEVTFKASPFGEKGEEYIAKGFFVDTKGFFGLYSVYGSTMPFRIENYGGGSWIIWKIK